MVISEEDHSLYKKTKRRILERKLELDNYVKKCSKGYRFEKQFQDLYKEGVISEIQLAREKKAIKTMIKNYEEDVSSKVVFVPHHLAHICSTFLQHILYFIHACDL